MTSSILSTKLYIPPVPAHNVIRERLLERLNLGHKRKLTLISASAGFGKSTLVSQWLGNCSLPAAWLSLDHSLREERTFLLYLISALQSIHPDFATELPVLMKSPQPQPMESLLTLLINQLAQISEDYLLVLDDYHILESRRIDEMMEFILAHQPGTLHLVITTREDPSLPLSRLRAQGQLVEMRVADLRFTPEEASLFLQQALNMNITEEQIQALEKRTEGWITGLQLAAISMEGKGDMEGFLQSFTGSHRFITDYLMEEVLHKQPQELQNFLLQTSILESIKGSLCDELLDLKEGRGQQILENLEQANLFIIPMDDRREWYRYHHLLADLLKQRLEHNAADNHAIPLRELHLRASQWYEKEGLFQPAVEHASLGENQERLAEILERAWPSMDAQFQSMEWLEAAETLPAEIMENRPVLLAHHAWALLDAGELHRCAQQLTAAEQCLERAGEYSVAHPPSIQEIPLLIASARSFLAQAAGDAKGALTYSLRAMELVKPGDFHRHWMACSMLSMAQLGEGRLEEAFVTFSRGMESIKKTDKVQFRTASVIGQVIIRQAQGYLNDCIRLFNETLEYTQREHRVFPWITSRIHLSLAALYLEQGKMEQATQELQIAEEENSQGSLTDWPYQYPMILARFREVQGKLEESLELLYQAESHHIMMPSPIIRPLDSQQCRIKIKLGRMEEVRSWISQKNLTLDAPPILQEEYDHITLVRWHLAALKADQKGELPPKLADFLDGLLRAAEQRKTLGSQVEILILQALLSQAADQLPEALNCIDKALSLAQSESYAQIFLDEGLPMVQLLARSKSSSPLKKQLLSHLRQKERDNGMPSDNPAGESLLDPLSPREMEVLQLIAHGYSNQQIGEKLFLALSTVKGHNRLIFDKLQVKRRTEAVVRARELGLID